MNQTGHARGADERGSATVHAVVLIGILVVAAMVAATVAALLVGHRRAAAGADLAALAGAAAIQQGKAACGPAARLATANGVQLARCTRDGDEVTVVVVTDVVSAFGRWLGPGWGVRARARAGPAG